MNNQQRSERKGYYSPGQDIHFQMTTPEEERTLFKSAQGEGREADVAREFIIHNHLLFARTEALRLAKGALPEDEVVSAGNFAIMKALKNFDCSRGRFTTYLRPFIRGEIAALWETKYNSAGILDPSMTSQYSVNNSQIHEQNNLVVGLHEESRLNLGKRSGNRSSGPVEEHPGEALDLQKFNREKLVKALESLTPVERELIEGFYLAGLSFAEIGRRRTPPVTRARVQAQHGEIVRKLRRRLSVQGVSDVI